MDDDREEADLNGRLRIYAMVGVSMIVITLIIIGFCQYKSWKEREKHRLAGIRSLPFRIALQQYMQDYNLPKQPHATMSMDAFTGDIDTGTCWDTTDSPLQNLDFTKILFKEGKHILRIRKLDIDNGKDNAQ